MEPPQRFHIWSRKAHRALRCAEQHPVRIWDERERLVTAPPVVTKIWGPSWGKELPGKRPRKTAET